MMTHKGAKRRSASSQFSTGTLERLEFSSTARKENQQCGFCMGHWASEYEDSDLQLFSEIMRVTSEPSASFVPHSAFFFFLSFF